jgi:uncharacterized protein (UPF0332 family)
MIPERASVIRYRVERAHESLAEARLLLEGGHVNTSVSRLYYACFYAASAALLVHDLVATTHGGLRTLIHQRLVKPGLLPLDMGRFYDTLFDNRQKGDYADLVCFDVRDVQGWLDRTAEFVRHLTELTQRLLEAAERDPGSPS